MDIRPTDSPASDPYEITREWKWMYSASRDEWCQEQVYRFRYPDGSQSDAWTLSDEQADIYDRQERERADEAMRRALESGESLAKELRECRVAAMAAGELRRIG